MGQRERDLLLRQYIAGRRTLRTALATWISRWFKATPSFRDADADRFVQQILPVVTGAQQSAASLSWAFQGRFMADLTGDPSPPPPIQVSQVTGQALRGVDPAEVYRRPFVEIYSELADGKSLTQAVTAGERRAKLIGLTDLELADTHAARAIAQADDRGDGWWGRQLTGDENCGLCIIASTQRYRRGDLMAIHPGCDCVPVKLQGVQPSQVLDPHLLEAAHEAIAQRFGVSNRSGRAIDYRKALLIRQHGELGPVLTVSRHKFTGPNLVSASGADTSVPVP